MQPGYICVAGIDLDTGRHVRPVTGNRRLGAHLLRQNHGPFDMAAIVDIGACRRVGRPPETEDHDFDPRRVGRLGDMAPDQFADLLRRTSHTRLRDVFGDALCLTGRTCSVEAGGGSASLGLLLPDEMALFLDERDTIRVSLTDEIGRVRLPVTDLRLYEDDFATPNRSLVRQIAGRIRDGEDVILSVGLTRPWSRDGAPPRHWLQVNNIVLGSDPTWQHASTVVR
jgi:hypothetical protein